DPTNPAFLDETEKAIRLLSEMPDTDVVLIPFYHAEDILPIRELSRRLGDRAHYVTEKLLSEEMLSLMGNLDLLVGVRLHSLIYAAVMGVPMVGLSYDPKIDAFLASVGLAPLSSTGDFTAEGFLAGYAAAAGKADPEKVAALSRRLRENDALLRQVAAGQTAGGEGRVGGIIGSVMLITVAAKMLGILRESFQAGAFGAADAFYAAFNKTIYLYTTIAYALCVAAVPTMTKALSRDKRQGARTANGLLTLTLLGSLLAMGGWIALTLPAGLATFWGGAEAAGYTRLMALSLPIIVAAYMMVALMQALDHYALQGSMSLPYSLCLILYLLIFGNRLPLWSYVLVVSLGWVVQFAMCLPYVRREKWRYRPVLELRADYVGGFVKTAFVTVVTNSMYLFCYLLDASRAAGLGEGVTTAFYYADKLFTPLTTTFIYSISAVMFPRLNRAYTSAGKSDYLRYVWGLLSGTLVIVFPVCALLLVFGGQILQVLFESGSFTAENTAETASIFRMYALGMAGFSAIDILSKAFFAMDKRAVPLAVSLGVVASTWGLNLAFGLSGAMLALTTAGSLTLGAGITAVILFRGEKLADLRDMGKSLVAALLMGLAAWGLRSLFVSGLEGKVVMVMKCGLIGVVALAVYVAAAWLLKLEALRNVVRR
ncbi:MAG: lipid II flippase MurJ, partial [bacterium]